jgi:hypothetical protein
VLGFIETCTYASGVIYPPILVKFGKLLTEAVRSRARARNLEGPSVEI